DFAPIIVELNADNSTVTVTLSKGAKSQKFTNVEFKLESPPEDDPRHLYNFQATESGRAFLTEIGLEPEVQEKLRVYFDYFDDEFQVEYDGSLAFVLEHAQRILRCIKEQFD
ncbi:hypothetical protein FOL47_011336, partial [Perkinsus chesapeaki]